MTDQPGFRYSEHFIENTASARRILRRVFGIVGVPRSAVDLGGGSGAWCSVMRELGVERVTCIDDPRIPADQLLVRPAEFVACDLAASVPAPVPCDLALSMEVAEHLPESRAAAVVDFLTASAGLVLFSSAIAGQPHGLHINPQPPTYWRDLFAQRGFARYDVVRPIILGDSEISYWYRQNLFLFADHAHAGPLRKASTAFPSIPDEFELVHSRVLETYRKPPAPPKLRDLVTAIPSALRRSLAARFGRLRGKQERPS